MVLCRCVGVDLQQPEEAHTGDSLQSGEASEEVSDDQQQLCKDGVKSTLGRRSCKCKGPGVGLVCMALLSWPAVTWSDLVLWSI